MHAGNRERERVLRGSERERVERLSSKVLYNLCMSATGTRRGACRGAATAWRKGGGAGRLKGKAWVKGSLPGLKRNRGSLEMLELDASMRYQHNDNVRGSLRWNTLYSSGTGSREQGKTVLVKRTKRKKRGNKFCFCSCSLRKQHSRVLCDAALSKLDTTSKKPNSARSAR